jgi:ATP-dependent Zn protease
VSQVGVGARRVRQLFKEARKDAPAIIFIDEIDSVASKRVGNSSQSQTLNQLLTEMDGFVNHDRVIVIGATNLPEVLDPAILRPGRFDKTIHLTAPDFRGRLAILQHYTGKIKTDPALSVESIARRTVQFTGAELRNLVNHAIMIAIKNKKSAADHQDFDDAYDRLVMGVSRRGLKGSPEALRATAFHEGTPR